MKIQSITTFVVKAAPKYGLQGRSVESPILPSSEYRYFHPYVELYGTRTEALVVRVATDAGIVGYGESQAPIGPEVVQQVIERVVGPVVLGKNPIETDVRFHEMYGSLRARGQTTGYQMDAIAAIDMALWDIKGKVSGLSVAELLGGRFRDSLPCYLSGSMLGPTPEARAETALAYVEDGVAGVKTYLGFGLAGDEEEVAALHAAIGGAARLMADTLWRYTYPEAIRVGRMLEGYGFEFMEAPLVPEDLDGHVRLAATLDIAIAVGEPLRTRYQFRPWLAAGGLDVCQPDPMRCGVSETYKIAALAEAFNIPIALHNGVSTAVGMAASWQIASVLPNFLIQEYQPQMIAAFGHWLSEPLVVENGECVVPTGPGLGIEIDEDQMAEDVDTLATIVA